jgi:hypothetical protein
MKNIILFILLIILVIIYYKNYFSIKEEFSFGSIIEMMKQGEPAFDVPVSTIVALNEQLQSKSGKKNDKEIDGFTGNRDDGISCNDYTTVLRSVSDSDSSYNHFKQLYNDEKDGVKNPEGPEQRNLTKYLSGMVRESILLGCSGECTIDITGIDDNAEICKNVEKMDEDSIEKRIIEYKTIIKDLWEAGDEKDDPKARWGEWDIYLSNNKNDIPNNDNVYDTSETYGTMPYKGLKLEVETSWFDL